MVVWFSFNYRTEFSNVGTVFKPSLMTASLLNLQPLMTVLKVVKNKK